MDSEAKTPPKIIKEKAEEVSKPEKKLKRKKNKTKPVAAGKQKAQKREMEAKGKDERTEWMVAKVEEMHERSRRDDGKKPESLTPIRWK